MANFVRIVPNSLWEDLEEKGLLAKAFPNNKVSKKEVLLEKIPQTLQNSAENLVNNLEWNDKFELVYKHRPIPKSNVAELLTQFILKSKKFFLLRGSDEFLKVLRNEGKARSKIREKKVSVRKDGLPRGIRIPKKQSLRRPKKGFTNAKRTKVLHATQTSPSSVSTTSDSLFPY